MCEGPTLRQLFGFYARKTSVAAPAVAVGGRNSSMSTSCAWDATETILKASVQAKEDSVLAAWARGYRQAFSCFPRLHVITERVSFARARHHLHGIPNVTYRNNDFAPVIAASTTTNAGSYIIIQWHLMWADNFTTAPYIFFFDVDAVPILPLRCHNFFDDEERLLLHAWKYSRASTQHPPAHWVDPDSGVLRAAQQRGERFAQPFSTAMADLDFMTFWPIIAPRWVLPQMRRLVTHASSHSYFDAAIVELFHGSHSDLIGKTAMVLFPERIALRVCPNIFNRSVHEVMMELSALYGRHAKRDDLVCQDRIFPVEHVKHPLQGLHSPDSGVRYKPNFKAAEYAHELLNQSHLFQQGLADVPHRLFAYDFRHRNASDRGKLSAALLREDRAGRVCGQRPNGSDWMDTRSRVSSSLK